MIIGLPHSSQSMSVVIVAGLDRRVGRVFAEDLATISALFCAPSFSSGMSFSTCARSAPVSFFIIFVLRHFGKLRTRGTARACCRVGSSGSALVAGDVVSIFNLRGIGLPCLSRLMIVLQLGSPFSFLTE
jgi:hypothetical protein